MNFIIIRTTFFITIIFINCLSLITNKKEENMRASRLIHADSGEVHILFIIHN